MCIYYIVWFKKIYKKQQEISEPDLFFQKEEAFKINFNKARIHNKKLFYVQRL